MQAHEYTRTHIGWRKREYPEKSTQCQHCKQCHSSRRRGVVEPRYELRIPNRFSASLWHFVSARTTTTPLIVFLTSKLVHFCHSFYSSSKQALGHFLVQEQVQVFEVENRFDVVGQGLREKSKTTQHFIEETSARFKKGGEGREQQPQQSSSSFSSSSERKRKWEIYGAPGAKWAVAMKLVIKG